jgi:hypothetical protein
VFIWLISFILFVSTGLQTAYCDRDIAYKHIRKLMSLPFLPHNHIEETFHRLRGKLNDWHIHELEEYLYKNWLQNTHWSVEEWCIFNQKVRTNNDLEG